MAIFLLQRNAVPAALTELRMKKILVRLALLRKLRFQRSPSYSDQSAAPWPNQHRPSAGPGAAPPESDATRPPREDHPGCASQSIREIAASFCTALAGRRPQRARNFQSIRVRAVSRP